jgi:hypothetical protein
VEPLVSDAAATALTIDDRMALPSVPIALDEVVAGPHRRAFDGNEPSLKRGEAYFYARHCTIGKFNTISHSRKRSGAPLKRPDFMDHLAGSLFRNENDKNNFIYTPVEIVGW